MTNYSLITNQTFDVKDTKQEFHFNSDDINQFDGFYNNMRGNRLFQDRKKPLLSQNEIDDFFVEQHEDHPVLSIPQGFEQSEKVKIDSFGKSYLASKHISLRTLLIIIVSFIFGALFAGAVVVGYYNLKNSVSIADEKLPLLENKIEKNRVLIENIKSSIEELSMRIDAVTNHLIQSEKSEKIK